MKTLSVAGLVKLAVALFCGWMLPAGAADVVVTFDPPSLPNGSKMIDSYDQAGVHFGGALTNSFAHTASGLALFPDSGSAHLTMVKRSAFFDMSGAAFSVKQVDIAEYSTVFAIPLTVSFTGLKADGSIVTASFTTDGVIDGSGAAADFQTFFFPASFSAVTNVGIASDGAGPAFENLVVSQSSGRLVLWNRLGSESEVRNSAVGSNALTVCGTFVPGVFGNGLQLNAVTNFAVAFPASVVPGAAGCIEFWAQFLNLPPWLQYGEQVVPVGVTSTNAAHTYAGPLLHFNGNDGAGNGGLCARLGGIGSAGTGGFGDWTYSSALKGASAADWHHYALVWSADAIPGFTSPVRRIAVYVDGALNTGSWLGAVVPPAPLALPEDARLGLLYLPALAAVRPVVDNVKIWDYAKTDFSDRFSEGAAGPWSLTISTACGQTVPAAGRYACSNGAVWSVCARSPVVEDQARYVCTGAVVTGNAYAQTSPTNVVLAVTNNAEVAWLWRTQYRLLTQAEGEGTLTPAELWQDAGSDATLTATPAPDWTFAGWKGDTGGCAVAGATIRAPMNRARALVAVFASVWPAGSGGLVLWNRMGSEAELGNSEIGPAGALDAGAFVPGVFGKACGVSAKTRVAATFPLGQLPRYSGCLEFWARAEVPGDRLQGGPRLMLASAVDTAGSAYPMVHFNDNDGAANGGLCGRLGGIGSAGTGAYGVWSFSRALGGAYVAAWHHYAMAWDVDGLKGQTNPVRRMAVYVDGVLNTGSWVGEVLPPSPVSTPEGWKLGLLFLQGADVSGAAIDNVKVWNFAKTDFSDRFRENAGVPRFDLTVSGTRGASEPADGTHSLASGALVSARVESPVGDGAARWVCTGATVTGNAYQPVSETNVLLAVTNTAALVWNWKAQFRLAVEAAGSGRVTAADEWQDEGAEVALSAAPEAGWLFARWEGDTAGCPIDGASIRVPMTVGRTIRAVFIERVVTAFETFAAWPENVPLAYRRLSGLWWFSNELGGLFCEPPKGGDSASFQITVSGPGLVTFEWQLFGADGTNALFCYVGGQLRGALRAPGSAQASVAVEPGSCNVRWAVRRGSGSPETWGLLRNIRWEPLARPSDPQPANGSQLPEREFAGLSWSGAADRFLVSAGLTASSLKPVGGGAFAACAVDAGLLAERVSSAEGNPIYWRADAVRVDSFGYQAVSAGPVWNVTVLPAGAPEFELAAYADSSLVVGARCVLGPFGANPGTGGRLSAKVTSGSLPPGLKLTLTGSAVSLAGVPARAGRYQATVRLSSRTEARKTVWGSSLLLDLAVAPLADAAGNYEGWADGSAYGAGSAQLSVTPKGLISGKLLLHGTNYTFKADSFDGATNGACFAAVSAKQGSRVALPLELVVTTDGVAQAAFAREPDALLALLRNSWTPAERAAFAGPLAGTYPVALPDLAKPAEPRVGTLTIQPNGKTQLSGVTAAQSRFVLAGNILIVPSDGSSPDRFFVVVYGALPRSGAARARGGLFGVLEIVPGESGANAVEAVVPLRAW